MSFLNNLLSQAAGVFDEKGEEAINTVLANALAALPAKDGLDPLSLGARNGAEEALKTLQQNSSKLHGIGQLGLAALLAKLAMGRTEEAAEILVQAQSDNNAVDDVVDRILANDAKSIAENEAYKEKKRKAVEVLRTIGSLTARYALPAILAVLQASLAK